MSLQKSVQIKIKNIEYNVPFPITGQLIDIQNTKSRFISDIKGSNDYLDTYAIMLAEMYATFTILIPDLIKDLNVKSIFHLSLLESKDLFDAYTKTYMPFFNEWMELIMSPNETANESSDQK